MSALDAGFDSPRPRIAIDQLRGEESEALHRRDVEASIGVGATDPTTRQSEHAFFVFPTHVGTPHDLREKEWVAAVRLDERNAATRADEFGRRRNRPGNVFEMMKDKEADYEVSRATDIVAGEIARVSDVNAATALFDADFVPCRFEVGQCTRRQIDRDNGFTM